MYNQQINFYPKKILIIDFSRIGDTLMHDPLLSAIKLKFPKAKITALTDRPNFDILANHPAISKAIIFPRVRNFKTLFDYMRKLWWIRRQKFDLLINLYMGGAGASIARTSGIPARISFDAKPKFCKTYNILVKSPSTFSNWIVETNEILRPLGIDPSSIWPKVNFYVTEAMREGIFKLLPKDAAQAYVALQLGASEEQKCWAVAKFVALSEILYTEQHLIPVVVATPDQLHKVNQFFELLPKHIPAVRLPILPLPKLAAVLEQMNLLVTGDTGVMHLGFGVNVATVGIFVNRPEHGSSATTNKIAVFEEDPTVEKHKSLQIRGSIQISVATVQQAVTELLMMQKSSA